VVSQLITYSRLCAAGLALLAAYVLAPSHPARALDVEFTSRPVKREILALYDSRHEATPSDTRLHRLAEMPLNWLGFKLSFADVNAPLPAVEGTSGFRAVVTWFIEPLQDPMRYSSWLDTVTAAGLRFVCLGDVAPPEPPGSEVFIARVLARLGLKPTDQFVNVTHKAKLAIVNAAMAGFERPIDKAVPEYRVMDTVSSIAKVHLSATTPGEEGPITSVLVATSPAGGYAADAFTIFYDATADKARWTLNPFAFFKSSLGDERLPVPDVTTVSGRRMYFSHIDGDGWNNISEIEGYREAQVTASEVILREVIAPYPDLPVTVGLIAGDTLPELGGMDAARQSAKELYALPQVEVASHSYSHPFNWKFFENYDRAAELQMIDKVAHTALSVMDGVRNFLYRVAGKSELTETQNRYVAGSADLPRSYLKQPFDLTTEVNKALQISQELAPPGKKAAIYLWSGDTEPFEAAIKATRAAGVRNMNGGDTRLDAEFPSVFYVPPIARTVGAERQIYASNSNENTYTNYWHGPFYGQLMLAETLRNTEQPRRLKPFNLYYHMYSGEKASSLAAIKYFVEQARTLPVIPVTASQYAAIADDFFAAEIQQVDATSWTITKRGAVQTVRFDDAADIDVDEIKSAGVLGATRHQGSLYVALDPAVEPAVVVIHVTTGLAARPFEAGHARLIESRWQLSSVVRTECGFTLSAQGFGPGDMVWQTAPSQSYDIEILRSGQRLSNGTVTADSAGTLKTNFNADAREPVEMRFTCHER
jgi:polysaccharide biosynthesis protein PelA